MKFRDPETGEVFEDIKDAYSKFCCGRDCDTGCPLNALKACNNWSFNHPAEAARLMGLEAVEDKMEGKMDKPEKIRTNFAKIIVSGKCENPYYEIMYFHPEKNELCIGYSSYNLEYVFQWLQDIFEVVENHVGDTTEMIKEEPMEKKDKPRICEVLGGKDNPLEVGEPFKIEGYNGEYHINDDGVLKWGGQTSDDAIYEAINHPDRIIRKPRFTPEEVGALRTLYAAGARWLARGDKHLRWYAKRPYQRAEDGKWDMQGDWGAMSGRLPAKLFPSLRPGQAVEMEDIIV